ncbi:MAG: P22 coat protein - gene protein 5 [Synergistetes bacterium ADurb.BinA166]|nr:MAG: P22 coat protein - gene protein 5 [Synergistetes bacterium ADurb.BinA166]
MLPSGSGTTKNQCLAFHRHAFALAMAPLSDMGGRLGAQIATVADPVTNLSIRSRLWYEGDTSTVKVALDALWGVQVLNPNLAVRAVQ